MGKKSFEIDQLHYVEFCNVLSIKIKCSNKNVEYYWKKKNILTNQESSMKIPVYENVKLKTKKKQRKRESNAFVFIVSPFIFHKILLNILSCNL